MFCFLLSFLNFVFYLKLSEESPLSFYAVYDGHAGKDAAAFAASNLHGRILESEHFPKNPVMAIKEAFSVADKIFLEKGKVEVIYYNCYCAGRWSALLGDNKGDSPPT